MVNASCTGISPHRAAKVYRIPPKSEWKGADPRKGPLHIPTSVFTTLGLPSVAMVTVSAVCYRDVWTGMRLHSQLRCRGGRIQVCVRFQRHVRTPVSDAGVRTRCVLLDDWSDAGDHGVIV
jgi:hypothetical protein